MPLKDQRYTKMLATTDLMNVTYKLLLKAIILKLFEASKRKETYNQMLQATNVRLVGQKCAAQALQTILPYADKAEEEDDDEDESLCYPVEQ